MGEVLAHVHERADVVPVRCLAKDPQSRWRLLCCARGSGRRSLFCCGRAVEGESEQGHNETKRAVIPMSCGSLPDKSTLSRRGAHTTGRPTRAHTCRGTGRKHQRLAWWARHFGNRKQPAATSSSLVQAQPQLAVQAHPLWRCVAESPRWALARRGSSLDT